MTDLFTIHTDGGSRGNPGPSAYGYVIDRPGEDTLYESAFLGTSTNNIAEYTAVLKALEHAHELGAKHVLLLSDSELMVKQMKGVYQVRNANLLPIYQAVKAVASKIKKVEFRHIPRAENAEADRLCNETMDDHKNGYDKLPRDYQLPPEIRAKPAPAKPSADEQAVALLHEVRAAWSQGKSAPEPADVWKRLQALR